MVTKKTISKKEGWAAWFNENWRSLAFLTYMVICVCDFIIMPLLYSIYSGHIDSSAMVQLALQFKDSGTQIEFLKLYGRKAWSPITMDGAGTFHMAYGAILTAAGYTRGQEQIEKVKLNRPLHTNLNQERNIK